MAGQICPKKAEFEIRDWSYLAIIHAGLQEGFLRCGMVSSWVATLHRAKVIRISRKFIFSFFCSSHINKHSLVMLYLVIPPFIKKGRAAQILLVKVYVKWAVTNHIILQVQNQLHHYQCPNCVWDIKSFLYSMHFLQPVLQGKNIYIKREREWATTNMSRQENPPRKWIESTWLLTNGSNPCTHPVTILWTRNLYFPAVQ